MNGSPAESRATERRWILAVYGAAAAAGALLLARNLAPYLRFEDAFIVLRYARNLLAGEGLVFNPGERVMGFTTPLHTLLTTLYLAAGGEAAPVLQNLAGLVFLVLGGLLVVILLARLGHPYLGLLAGLLSLTNLHLNYLYLGMEVHLFAFLVLLSFLLWLEDRPAAVGATLGLAFLTRYDGALLAGLIGLAAWAGTRRPPWRLAVAWSVVAAPWLLFAWLYYDSLFPAPLEAKGGHTGVASYLLFVFYTVKETFKRLAGLVLPWAPVTAGLSYLFLPVMAVGILAARRRDWRFAVLGVYPFLHVGSYALIGADPQFTWHYYVVYPITFLFVVLGAAELVRAGLSWLWTLTGRPPKLDPARLRPRLRRLAPAGALLVAAPLLAHLLPQSAQRYELDPRTRQLYEIGSWLGERYDPETSLLYPEIGVVGYQSGLRIIDRAGLVTPGLYYFHEYDATPIEEILERFSPDLILLSAASPEHRIVEANGFRPIRVFEGHLSFTLYEKGKEAS